MLLRWLAHIRLGQRVSTLVGLGPSVIPVAFAAQFRGVHSTAMLVRPPFGWVVGTDLGSILAVRHSGRQEVALSGARITPAL